MLLLLMLGEQRRRRRRCSCCLSLLALATAPAGTSFLSLTSAAANGTVVDAKMGADEVLQLLPELLDLGWGGPGSTESRPAGRSTAIVEAGVQQLWSFQFTADAAACHSNGHTVLCWPCPSIVASKHYLHKGLHPANNTRGTLTLLYTVPT